MTWTGERRSFLFVSLSGAIEFNARSSAAKWYLANAWQLLAELQINHSSSTDTGFSDDHSGVFADYFAYDFLLLAERIFAHLLYYLIRLFARQNRHEFAFVGNVKRIESEHFASRTDNARNGKFIFLQTDADV